MSDTTFDFGDGPVPATRHINLDGREGGWVASTARVAPTVYIGHNARVYGYARVYGAAHVYGDAHVCDYAHVYGDARVYGYAHVCDYARVYGAAHVYGYARVYGDARVYGAARVYGYAEINSNASVGVCATVGEYTHKIKRSDGYTFCYLPCADGIKRVFAGCRVFTMEEAREHWQETRGGTPLGDETMAILDFLERVATT